MARLRATKLLPLARLGAGHHDRIAITDGLAPGRQRLLDQWPLDDLELLDELRLLVATGDNASKTLQAIEIDLCARTAVVRSFRAG